MRFLVALLLALPLQVFAQYPQRAIKMIVPFPPAGATDIVGRIVAQKLTERLGQSVFVENRPGAGGTIGSDIVAKSAPDGYTLLMATSSTHSIGPALQKLPYDPIKDFAQITQVATVPDVLVVSPKLPVANVKELIEYARARPGKLNFASSGIGTVVHLNGELFKMLTGLDIVHVPYKGTALSIPDLASGNVSMLFDSLASAMPNIKSGTVKPLALNATRRSHLLPDVPTLAEAGLPAFDRYTWFGMFAPAGTPPEIVKRLEAECMRIAQLPDIKEKLRALSSDAVGNSSAEFTKELDAEIKMWTDVARQAKLSFE